VPGSHGGKAFGLTKRVDGWTGFEILDRDGWLCQVEVCFYPAREISREFAWPPPDLAALYRYPTVDHIAERKAGVDHSALNRRAAHWVCNRYRGASTLPSLPADLPGWENPVEPALTARKVPG